MKQKRDFVTADLYLAAFLSISLNQFPSFKVELGKTLFIFPGDATLYKAIRDYNGNAQINAFHFAEQIKRLRGEMLSRRGMGRANGQGA
jgi:hypothetical protein